MESRRGWRVPTRKPMIPHSSTIHVVVDYHAKQFSSFTTSMNEIMSRLETLDKKLDDDRANHSSKIDAVIDGFSRHMNTVVEKHSEQTSSFITTVNEITSKLDQLDEKVGNLDREISEKARQSESVLSNQSSSAVSIAAP